MTARAWLAKAKVAASEHRSLVEATAAVIAGLAVSVVIGVALHGRASALKAERTRLERVAAIADEWRGIFQPPTQSEQLAWRRADRELGELGLRAPAHLELIRLVSARAEEVGIPDTRVQIAPAGDIALPDRSADTLRIYTADFVLRVQYTGGLDATRAFLSVLPAALEPYSITVEMASGSVRTALTLAVYIVESNDTEQDIPGDAISGAAAADRAGNPRRALGRNASAAGSAAR